MISDETYDLILSDYANGDPLKVSLQRHTDGITPGQFRQWALEDDKRKAKYMDAEEVGIESLVDYSLEVAKDEVMDPTRSKIITDVVKFIATTRSRERYGAHIRHENTFTVDLVGAMETAEKRLQGKTFELQRSPSIIQEGEDDSAEEVEQIQEG